MADRSAGTPKELFVLSLADAVALGCTEPKAPCPGLSCGAFVARSTLDQLFGKEAATHLIEDAKAAADTSERVVRIRRWLSACQHCGMLYSSSATRRSR